VFDLIYRFDPSREGAQASPADPEEARRLLVRGNQDFAEMTDPRQTEHRTRVIAFDPRAFGWGVTAGEGPVQAPFAAVLGCADARVPTEMIFSKGCNELFVVRVAGNVLGAECLGSLRYAVAHFPDTLKLLVVLAHGKCGAVTEAVDVYLQPHRYIAIATDHAVRAIEDQILVAVRVAAIAMKQVHGADVERHPRYRTALIEVAVTMNAAWSAYSLSQEFQSKRPGLKVAFGVYDLVSRNVRMPLSVTARITEEEKGLFAPPEDADDFRELALRLCGSGLTQELLNREVQS
jgi:carbonic anhydrase